MCASKRVRRAGGQENPLWKTWPVESATFPLAPRRPLHSLLAWLTFNDFSNFSLGCLHSLSRPHPTPPPPTSDRSHLFQPAPPPPPLFFVVPGTLSNKNANANAIPSWLCLCSPPIFPASLIWKIHLSTWPTHTHTHTPPEHTHT